MNHLPPPPPAVTVDRSNELIAVLKDRVRSMVTQRTTYAEALVGVGEICYKLRECLPRIVYGERVREFVNLKTARRAIERYLATLPVTAQPAKQNPETRCPSGTEIGTGKPACQTAAQPLSQDDLEDLLGCTPVPPSVVVDAPEAGEGEGVCEGGFEDEFGDDGEWEQFAEGAGEFEISNLKFESGDPLRREDAAPPPPGAGEELKAHRPEACTTPLTGPQLTLASLYEQAQTVGSEFMRVIESGLDEAVKARLVADVRALVQTAQDSAGAGGGV